MTISQSSTADRAEKPARASASAVSLLAQSLPLGVEANCTALFHDLEAISVELRLMHPLGAGRRRLGRRRGMEDGNAGTLSRRRYGLRSGGIRSPAASAGSLHLRSHTPAAIACVTRCARPCCFFGGALPRCPLALHRRGEKAMYLLQGHCAEAHPALRGWPGCRDVPISG